MVGGDVATTGCAMLDMHAGFRALPVDPKTKAPFGWLTPLGVRDATDDPATLQQWMAVAGAHDGAAGLAIVPGPGFAIIDDDTGKAHSADYGLTGTFEEETRRGRHWWTILRDGRTLRKSRLPGGVGDLITGTGAYAVMSPTANYRPVDVEAPILTLPDDSPLWTYATRRERRETTARTTMAVDRREAARLAMAMRQSTEYGPGIAALLDRANDWPRHFPTAQDISGNGRDFQLALAASHFLRDHPRRRDILVALLHTHSQKAKRHRTPDHYVAIVVDAALDSRTRTDGQRLTLLKARFAGAPAARGPSLPPDPLHPPHPLDVLDGTPPLEGTEVDHAIVAFAGCDEVDVYSRNDRWRRIPVQDIATLHGVNRRTVTRRLEALEARGVIERQAVRYTHDGRTRCDSLVRLTVCGRDEGPSRRDAGEAGQYVEGTNR